MHYDHFFIYLKYAIIRDMSKKTPINKKNYLIIALLAIVIFSIASFVYARVFKAVAKVNGESITRVKYIEELEKQAGKKVLDTMITRTLIYQIAESKKATVSDKEIQAEIKKIESNLKSQKTSLDEVLKAQNMTKSDLSERIKLNLLSQKLVEKTVKVADTDVEEYIETNPTLFPQQPVSQDVKNQIKEQIRQEKISQQIQLMLNNARKKSDIDMYLQ